jgi:threonyl-tRNA synthetase
LQEPVARRGAQLGLVAPARAATLKISLPDGSVREMPAGSTPADVAAAIGPGLAKAALAARIDGELVDLTLPFTGDASLALVTARDEADALELARHDLRMCWPKRCRRCFPARRSPSGRRPTTGSIMISRQRTAPFTDEDLPAIEAQMRKIIAADKPLRREVWSRDALIAAGSSRAKASRPNGPPNCPGDEPLTVYWSGDDWMDMCRGPHLPSPASLIPSLQADARIGRLLARRPEQCAAQPHLRHRLAQQEAA